MASDQRHWWRLERRSAVSSRPLAHQSHAFLPPSRHLLPQLRSTNMQRAIRHPSVLHFSERACIAVPLNPFQSGASAHVQFRSQVAWQCIYLCMHSLMYSLSKSLSAADSCREGTCLCRAHVVSLFIAGCSCSSKSRCLCSCASAEAACINTRSSGGCCKGA